MIDELVSLFLILFYMGYRSSRHVIFNISEQLVQLSARAITAGLHRGFTEVPPREHCRPKLVILTLHIGFNLEVSFQPSQVKQVHGRH